MLLQELPGTHRLHPAPFYYSVPNKEQRWENFETIGTLRKGLAYPCVAVLHYGSQKHCSQILQEKLKSETPLLRLRVCE